MSDGANNKDDSLPGPENEGYWKKRLQTRRREITLLMDAHEADTAPVELDQTRVGRLSRMDAIQTQAMAQETRRRRVLEIERIDMALQRVQEGEFGACVRCGEDIAAKRLDIDPAVPLCTACAGNR